MLPRAQGERRTLRITQRSRERQQRRILGRYPYYGMWYAYRYRASSAFDDILQAYQLVAMRMLNSRLGSDRQERAR